MKRIVSIIFTMIMALALAIGGSVLLVGCNKNKQTESNIAISNSYTWTLLTGCTISLNANGGSGGTTEFYSVSVKNFVRKTGQLTFPYSDGRYFFNTIGTSSSTSPIVSTITVPTRANYAFLGYFTAASGGTQTIDSSGTVLATAASYTSHTTWYAHWATGYTVSFSANGGNGTMPNRTWAYGEWYSVQPLFTRTGYTFSGWSISTNSTITHYYGLSTSSYSTTTAATFVDNCSLQRRYYKNLRSSAGTVTFTAQWTIDKYTINVARGDIGIYDITNPATSWNYNGGNTVGGGKSNVYEYGTSITISVAVNSGYSFSHWSDGSTVNRRTITVTGNATYTAYTTPNKYVTTFNANGGSMCSPLDTWELTGGATYNASTGEVYFPNAGAQITSPLIYVGDTNVNNVKSVQLRADFKMTETNAGGPFASIQYLNSALSAYSGNGWAAKAQGENYDANIWVNTGPDWWGGEYVGADICSYIRVTIAYTSDWSSNAFYCKNVSIWIPDTPDDEYVTAKNVAYNSLYGELPTPTRENYTFDCWKKGVSVPSKTGNAWVDILADNSFITANLRPSTTYRVGYDLTLNEGIPSGYFASQKRQWGNLGFRLGTADYNFTYHTFGTLHDKSGDNPIAGKTYHIETIMSTPSDLSTAILLWYTARCEVDPNDGTVDDGYVLNGTIRNLVFYNEEYATSINNSSTYNTVGNEVLYAKWAPVLITNNVYIRLISKDGNTTSVSSAGGYVEVSRYKIRNGVPIWETYTQKDDVEEPYTDVHQGQQFRIVAYANSGYVFAGFSTSPTPSSAIKNPSSPPGTTANYYPTSGTDYYVYFKQMSGNQLKYDSTDKYFYFEDGYYPQSEATNASTLNSSARANGEVLTYCDGVSDVELPVYTYGSDRYVKVSARGETKWFKFEPIRWRVSDYGIAKTEKNIARYTSLYNLRNYASYATNFTAVSDLILGVGAMHDTRNVDENLKNDAGKLAGTYSRDFVGYQNVMNTTNGVNLNFNYSASTSYIDIERYGCTDVGNGNAVYNSVDDFDWAEPYSAPLRIVSMKELGEVGFVNKQARASDMVAFILGQDKNNVSYWTRDLSNLGAGVAITPTGTVVRPWLDQVLGMRFAYTFREGSNAGGGNIIYNRVNYIQATGTQWIDTGFVDTQGITSEFKANWQDWGLVVGQCEENEPHGRNSAYLRATGKFILDYGDYNSEITSGQYNTDYVLKFSTVIGNAWLDINGTRSTSLTQPTTLSPSNLWIFNNLYSQVHREGDLKCTKAKLYYAKIYDHNGVLVRDFVPVKNAFTGEVGLWDNVTERFYGNAGTGVFLAG